MPVSVANSQVIYDALKACDVRLISALPETWLVHLIRMAEDDPEMTLVRLAKEEEAIGISAGAHLAGVKSALLMQNHGFLAAINGIVSLAQLYRIPLLMLISYRGDFGERDPWQTQGGSVTEAVLRALGIPYLAPLATLMTLGRDPRSPDARRAALTPVALLLDPRPDVGGVAMMRADALQAIYPELRRPDRRDDHGRRRGGAPRPRPPANFFYLQHAMGLASSMGLGIALALPRQRSSCSTATARC